MFRKELKDSIRYKFLKDIFVIILISTVVLTTVIAINEDKSFENSLKTKGQSFASYIAKLSLDPLVLRDGFQLDSLVSEANTDEEIAYTVILDAKGNLMTSQFASINHLLPKLQMIVSGLSKDSDVPAIIAAIKKKEPVTELTVPIRTSDDSVGTVTVGLLEYKIHQQIRRTILFVIAINLVVALVLGVVLFIVSKKSVLDPIIELSRAADQLAKGDLFTHVDLKATGEVKMLVDSFNKMATYLEKTTVSRDYMDAMINSIHAGIVVIDPEKHEIVDVNSLAVKMIGIPRERILGRVCHSFICPAEAGKCPITDLLQRVDHSERTLLTAQGGRIPILKSAVPLLSKGRKYLIENFIDITESKRTEEKLKNYAAELEQANEDIKMFSYTVSHDLRAPLVNIRGFSEELKNIIQEGGPLVEKCMAVLPEEERKTFSDVFEHDVAEAVGYIGASVVRMDGLIESILKLSRLGRSELKPELVHTEKLLQALLKSLEHQIESHQTQVTVSVLPNLVIDKTALERIFGNILDNALKYLEDSRPGRIEITTERNAEELIFTIRDNGRGIAPEDIPMVFDLFRRMGTQDVPGEGIGLTYVKTLVKRLGGRIWCESELGKGTAFKFTIPKSMNS